MIVISGALVLVALVLLVIGIVGPELGFVYASIGVSLVSLVFLVIGILQRRGETLPATAGAPAPTPRVDAPVDTVTAVIPSQARPVEPAPVAASADEELETGGTVLVVAGRPRYHVAGCRYLSGKDAEAVDVLDAREEGFTPCGVCKPDDALAALQAEEAALEDDVVEEEPALPLEEVEASTPTRVRATSRTAPTRTVAAAPVVEQDAAEPAPPTRGSRAAKAVPATAATAAVAAVAAVGAVKAAKSPSKTATSPAKAAAKAPAAAPEVPVKAAKKVPAKAAATAPAKAPSKAATLAADSTPAAATAKRTGAVVVIPERGRFHRAECRYVRGVDGAESLTRAAATRQGYEACGVCKP